MSLTMTQRRFLSARAVSLSDDEALLLMDANHNVEMWKKNPEFLASYNVATQDQREAVQMYAHGLLDEATQKLHAMLSAVKYTKFSDEPVPDWDAIAKAASLIYDVSGLKKSSLDLNQNVGVQLINDSVPRAV